MMTESMIWKKREQVLAALRLMREQQQVVYSGNLIDEVRQEREDEENRLWGEPS